MLLRESSDNPPTDTPVPSVLRRLATRNTPLPLCPSPRPFQCSSETEAAQRQFSRATAKQTEGQSIPSTSAMQSPECSRSMLLVRSPNPSLENCHSLSEAPLHSDTISLRSPSLNVRLQSILLFKRANDQIPLVRIHDHRRRYHRLDQHLAMQPGRPISRKAHASLRTKRLAQPDQSSRPFLNIRSSPILPARLVELQRWFYFPCLEADLHRGRAHKRHHHCNTSRRPKISHALNHRDETLIQSSHRICWANGVIKDQPRNADKFSLKDRLKARKLKTCRTLR